MMQLNTFMKLRSERENHNVYLGDNVLPHPSFLEGLPVATSHITDRAEPSNY